MVLARKPGSTVASERQIESLINKGGDVPAGRPGRPSGRTDRKTGKVLLRMPGDLLSRVDEAVDARPLPMTRHAWLLEAVLEKLQRVSD